MPRDIGIADRLRAAGCKVVEIDGWRTRGSDTFSPRGSVDHHTAGSRVGNAPSLGICINGREDLPGPLCHVLIGRDLTCYVIAAGRANHAGAGGWNGLVGNSSVFGIERENVGTTAEPWTDAQTKHSAKCHRALLRGENISNICRHQEWAPTRKIDTHTIQGSTLRMLAAQSGDDMFTPEQEAKIYAAAVMIMDGVPAFGVEPVGIGVTRTNWHLNGTVVEGHTPTPIKKVLLDQMKADQTAVMAAIAALPAKVVAALPPGGGGGLTEAQVKAACVAAINEQLGFLKPGQ